MCQGKLFSTKQKRKKTLILCSGLTCLMFVGRGWDWVAQRDDRYERVKVVIQLSLCTETDLRISSYMINSAMINKLRD